MESPEDFSLVDKVTMLRRVAEDGNYLLKIPESIRTTELYNCAVKHHGWLLGSIPTSVITLALCELAVICNATSLQYVPLNMRTFKLCMLAIHLNPDVIIHVPEKYCTLDMYVRASNYGIHLKYIPPDYRTLEICCNCFRSLSRTKLPDDFLAFLPTDLRGDMHEKILKENGLNLKYVHSVAMTQTLCNIAVRQNFMALEFVPSRFCTPEMALSVMQTCTYMHSSKLLYLLEFIPPKARSARIYRCIAMGTGKFDEIPAKYRTVELYTEVTKMHGRSLQYVPMEMRTLELCRAAIRQRAEAIEFVPNDILPLL
jgi:ribosomal protein S14